MLRTLREGRARRLLFLLGVVVFAAYGMVKSSCDFESNGESGSLTCHFSENIESLKYDFNVQHYYPQSSHVSPEYILDCMWSLIGRLNCRVLDDSYKFDSLVSDTLAIRIPQLTEHQEGRFVCQVVPSEPGDIQPCMYNHSASSKTEPAIVSNLPEWSVEEDDSEKGNGLQKESIIIGLAVGIPTGLLVLVLLTLLLVLTMRGTFAKTGQSDQGGKSTTDDTGNESGANEQLLDVNVT